MRFVLRSIFTFTLLAFFATSSSAQNSAPSFRAGAVAIDITPREFPRIIAGGFLEGRGDKVTDPLHARGIVLDDGTIRIAFAIVDTCMMQQALIDEAKAIASRECGIPTDRMMVSATHTHSAPAAMGCLGTRPDKEYAAFLTTKVAECIVAAAKNLQPARIGWSSVDDWGHTHNRRWIRKPEAAVVDPFGEKTGLANMHPGYQSADVIGPSGPVDPGLSVISIQTRAGKPLAVLANYSQHYFGSSPVSADYYGHFCKHIARLIGEAGDGNGPFVCAMSQGTSGDLMWMDYGAPKKDLKLDGYAEAVAMQALEAIKQVTYHDTAPLAMVEKQLSLAYRVPDAKRLAWAQRLAKEIENDLPKDKPHVYAREAVILHERKQTNVKLQAIRIGELTIATLPNEVYAITGLKLKAQSPGAMHFNIELANGAEGYIPTPEQHVLGGYTTWPARTAGLEVQAEPKMVETLLGALEEVTGKPKRKVEDEHGPYAQAVLGAKPVAYWRMNEFEGRTLKNAVPGGSPAMLTEGFAWYLPGVGSGTGTGSGEALTASAFSGSRQTNRAVHLVGAELQTPLEIPTGDYSIAVWFWLGEASGASERGGTLIRTPDGAVLRCEQDEAHRVRLAMADMKTTAEMNAADWHMALLVREGDHLKVHLDGRTTPDIQASIPGQHRTSPLRLGEGLQGKLDEIAVFNRALSGLEIAQLWNRSGIAADHARDIAHRAAQKQQFQAFAIRDAGPIKFAEGYLEAMQALNPIALRITHDSDGKSQGWNINPIYPMTWVNPHRDTPLGDKWSAAIWFRNDMPNNARPVTAYLLSRGPEGDRQAPGDHLGIGGTYKDQYTGKLIVFNGNVSNEVVAGSTVISPGTWNHVVMVRDGNRVRAWLNGAEKPEIDGELPVTAAGVRTVYAGKRCDDFAPLKGSLVQHALFDRALTRAEAVQLYATSGVTATSANPPARTPASTNLPANPSLASPPLSPEESLKKWHVREGYRIELAAAEPVVLDPVAFDWDEKGRLWVVEMADYPLGLDGNGKPGGRVVMLEDTNHDARYDKRTVVAEGLNFPTGILTWRDGALVTAAPDVLYLGPTGEKKVLLTGFSTGNQQLRVNGLRWGMDGWVYCAAGAHHGGYNKGTEITSVLTGEKIVLGSRDFRFKPDTGEFDPQSGPSQFGRARDDWGHWFGVQNSFPLWHYQLQDHYLRRNPHVIPPDPIHQLFPRNPRVYPVSSMEKRFHSFGESGRFTSACGIEIYRDRVLFDDGKTHAFTCEPFHNVVQHHVLENDGVTFKATRDPAESKHDFLASEDRWCRPVMVRTGPDGALWVADMYRYMIEHPQWLPQNGKDELLPHYREGDDKGRIWRVLRTEGSAAERSETTAAGSPKGEAGRAESNTPVRSIQANFKEADRSVRAPFNSQNGWVRDKAQMMMAQGTLPPVDSLARLEGPAKAQAAWSMLEAGSLKLGACVQLMMDDSPRIREQALQMAEHFDWEQGDSPGLRDALTKLATDPDDKVRLQLACSLGSFPGEAAADALVELLNRAPAGSPVAGAAMSSALPHLERLSSAFAEGADPRQDAIIADLFRCALSADRKDVIAAILRHTKTRPRLISLLEVLNGKGLSLSTYTASVKSSALYPQIRYAQELLRQDLLMVSLAKVKSQGENASLEDLRLLAADLDHRSEVTHLLPGLWKRATAQNTSGLLALIARLQPQSAPEFLLARWNERTPSLRSQILETLLSNDAWTLTLLERIQAKQLDANACDAATRARLTKHPKPEVKKLAAAVFADSGSSARAAILEKFKPALQLKGNATNGKAVFTQICISCHKLDDVGLELGPDLRSVAQHEGEKLLNSILDPGAIIEPGFMAYHCTLKSGEQLYGVIATETSTSLTLKLPGNVTRSVLRSEVTSLKSTNTSLMPDGLEAALTPQSLADLIAYLKRPR